MPSLTFSTYVWHLAYPCVTSSDLILTSSSLGHTSLIPIEKPWDPNHLWGEKRTHPNKEREGEREGERERQRERERENKH